MEQDREHRRAARVLFASLVIVFGLQSMRFLFASLAWYLRDTVGIGVLDLIPIALAPFLLAAVLPIAARWVGFRNALTIGVFLLIAARLLNQIASDPGLELWFAAGATLAFVGLLPFLLTLGRSAIVAGVLIGIAIDSGIKGLGMSLDLAYQPGWRPVVAVAALGAALAWAFSALGGVRVQGVGWRSGLPLLGLAPFLFIQMLLLQNQGWTSAVTGVSGPTAQLRIAILNVVAIYLAHRLAGNRVVFIVSLALLVVTVIAAEGSAGLYNVLSVLAIPAAALVWAGIVPEPGTDRLGIASTYLIASATVFLIFGLAYYVPLDMSLGFEGAAVRIAAGIGVGILGLAALPNIPSFPAIGRADWLLAGVVAVLPIVAFISAAAVETTEKAELDEPIRFVSYNIHSAFNPSGTLDLDAIAQVIEDTRADVVGLQELPRGRLLSGNTDMLTLLQLELGFEHVAYFGTTDPVWGNAVLSRYPIVAVETDYLPKVGTPMQRGSLGATIRAGDREILVISTHLQHVNDSDLHDTDPEADLLPVHQEQIAEILEAWSGRQPAVLLGDFNARPDWAQIGILLDAGWLDVWDEAGVGDGFTSNSVDPRYRIDYIFHTGDMAATDAGVIQSLASDHLAVVADLVFEG